MEWIAVSLMLVLLCLKTHMDRDEIRAARLTRKAQNSEKD